MLKKRISPNLLGKWIIIITGLISTLLLISCSGLNTDIETDENKADVRLLSWDYDGMPYNPYRVRFHGIVKNVGTETAHLTRIKFYLGENPTEDKEFWVLPCDFDNYVLKDLDNELAVSDTASFLSDWYKVTQEVFYQMTNYSKKNINIQILWDEE